MQDRENLLMNYSPKAAYDGVNPDTVGSVSARRVINSWAHELIRLEYRCTCNIQGSPTVRPA